MNSFGIGLNIKVGSIFNILKLSTYIVNVWQGIGITGKFVSFSLSVLKFVSERGAVVLGDGGGRGDDVVLGGGYLSGEDVRSGRGGVDAAADRDGGGVLPEDGGGVHGDGGEGGDGVLIGDGGGDGGEDGGGYLSGEDARSGGGGSGKIFLACKEEEEE